MFWNKKVKTEKEEAPKKTISGQLSDINSLYFASQELAYKIAMDDSKSLDERITFLRNAVMKKEPDLVESETLDKLRSDLERVEKSFSRLVERAGNDSARMAELNKDLRDYFLALHNLKMAWCIMETDLTNNGAENYGNQVAEPEAIKTELEKKLTAFNKFI